MEAVKSIATWKIKSRGKIGILIFSGVWLHILLSQNTDEFGLWFLPLLKKQNKTSCTIQIFGLYSYNNPVSSQFVVHREYYKIDTKELYIVKGHHYTKCLKTYVLLVYYSLLNFQ